MSLDDDLLSDAQSRLSLYHLEEYNIKEERDSEGEVDRTDMPSDSSLIEEFDDDNVFIDSVETIVEQHVMNKRQAFLTRTHSEGTVLQRVITRPRISSEPNYRATYVIQLSIVSCFYYND